MNCIQDLYQLWTGKEAHLCLYESDNEMSNQWQFSYVIICALKAALVSSRWPCDVIAEVSSVRAFCCFWIFRIWDCYPPRINAECCYHFSASCSHRPDRQSHSYWTETNSPHHPHENCRFTLHVTIINISLLNLSLSFTACIFLLCTLHI